MKTRALRIADDFGLGHRHNRIILELMENGHVDGTSVMIDGEIAPEDLARLKKLRARGAPVGLHLNLTHGFEGTPAVFSLRELFWLCLTGQSPKGAGAAFERQSRTFIELFGSAPDHYDGHQHCHCLPRLSSLAAALPRGAKTWMRAPLPANLQGLVLNMRSGGIKVAAIAAFAWQARKTFHGRGWVCNDDFSGFLRLGDPDDVARWLPRLIRAADKRATGGLYLLMVHPGAADDARCPGHAAESRAREAEILRQGSR